MKKLIMIMFVTMLLTSCSPPTQQEIDDQKKICDVNGQEFYFYDTPSGYEPSCRYKPPKTTVMDCIQEYTEGLDEKYNNPDTVSNLKEDDYSTVVKTCNEIFGEKDKK